MKSPDTLARIRSHLLALQQEAGGADEPELELWNRRLTRLEASLAEIVRPSAPAQPRRIESELRSVIRLYAGYKASYVAYAECVDEETVRIVRRALRTTAAHGVPEGKPFTAGANTTQGLARGWS